MRVGVGDWDGTAVGVGGWDGVTVGVGVGVGDWDGATVGVGTGGLVGAGAGAPLAQNPNVAGEPDFTLLFHDSPDAVPPDTLALQMLCTEPPGANGTDQTTGCADEVLTRTSAQYPLPQLEVTVVVAVTPPVGGAVGAGEAVGLAKVGVGAAVVGVGAAVVGAGVAVAVGVGVTVGAD